MILMYLFLGSWFKVSHCIGPLEWVRVKGLAQGLNNGKLA